MGRYGAAWVEAAKKQGPVVVARIEFPNGTLAVATTPFDADRPYVGRIGEMDTISIGVPAKPGQLGFPETGFKVYEDDRKEITLAIESQDARRAPVTISWLARASESDPWQEAVLFTGILDRWKQTHPGTWDLTAKPDSKDLEGSIPKKAILKGEHPLADVVNKNPFGTYMPQVYGVHDSAGLSGKGMIPTINIQVGQVESTLTSDYLISQGYIAAATKVFVDGILKTAGVEYNFMRKVKAGTMISYVAFSYPNLPTPEQVVTVDADGFESVGDGSGGVLTNPVAQLRHWLTNFGLGDHRSGNWLALDALIDPESWAEAESWADIYAFEGAMRIGGSTEQQEVVDVVNGWLESWPEFRIHWNHLGKLAFGVMTPILEDSNLPREHWVRGDDMISFAPETDTAQIMTRINQTYLYGVVDGKFWQSLDLQDLTQPDKNAEDISADFSSARLV